MPHLFFFSYARSDGNGGYLKVLFDDLSNRVREQLGLNHDETVGFLDHNDIELGANWKAELHDALQTCPVLVSVYSPAYFNSCYCGKEWEVFRRRQELYVRNAEANGENLNAPPVIKPVIWIPLLGSQTMPAAVGPLQYYLGDEEADHNSVGLLRMIRRANDYVQSYDDFLEELKNQIIAAQNFNLPPLPDFTLEEIPSAFDPPVDPPGQPASQQPVSPITGGPQFVRFGIIAAQPDDFPGGVRAREFYENFGGPDWKPYYEEDPRPIMLVAQRTANEVGIYSDHLPFGPALATQVKTAEDNGSLVVLFVDCWTAELPFYQSILKDFDENVRFNCSIFIPWNDKDSQSAERREALLELVRNQIFRRWSSFAKGGLPCLYDAIPSMPELQEQLKTALEQLRTRVGKGIMERATKETIPRRIETDITRPIMTHKPTDGATT